MLKVVVDFLASNWAVFLQAPLTFVVAGAIGFVAGTFFLKNQNDVLKERLNLREDQLKEKDNEIKVLTAEVTKIREEKRTPVQNLGHRNSNHENYLSLLSTLELSREALKMSRKLETSSQLSQQRQDLGSSHIDTGLYNEWLSEGPKLLAIKHEALKRLPDDAKFQVDQISDSRYTSPAFQAYSVMDMVGEIKSIGLKLAEYDDNQVQIKLSVQTDNSIMAD